ncbi:4Fe-4S binding protein [Candidatus Bathyarchaeota archaeon]|nr:4Fe-4S binding protein [Candidatus Bathyarchaeota archaeon]
MVSLKQSRFLAFRIITVTSISLVFVSAPLHGTLYGTGSALNLGIFKLISPLDWLLLNLGAGKIVLDLLVLGLIVILGVIIFGRFLCGWVCPVGIILDYMNRFTESRRRISGTQSLEKYVILSAVLLADILFKFTAPYIYSPPGIVHRILIQYLTRGIVGVDLAALSLIIISNGLVGRYGRTWCRNICPLGTLISSLGVVNLFRPKVEVDRCIECFECEDVCPMRIHIVKSDRWDMMSCIKCFECLERCPVKAMRLVFN